MMDKKTETMIALSAAIGANCIPCFDHLYAKARELDLQETDIRSVAEIAYKVKNGAQIFMKIAVNEMTGAPEEGRPHFQPTEGCCN